METVVLGDSVVRLDLQSLSDSALVPVGDTCDEFAFIPENPMLTSVSMVDDRRLVPFVSPSMGSMLLKPGGKGAASLSDVHLTTFTRNAVDSREILGKVLVFVGTKDRLKLA